LGGAAGAAGDLAANWRTRVALGCGDSDFQRYVDWLASWEGLLQAHLACFQAHVERGGPCVEKYRRHCSALQMMVQHLQLAQNVRSHLGGAPSEAGADVHAQPCTQPVQQPAPVEAAGSGALPAGPAVAKVVEEVEVVPEQQPQPQPPGAAQQPTEEAVSEGRGRRRMRGSRGGRARRRGRQHAAEKRPAQPAPPPPQPAQPAAQQRSEQQQPQGQQRSKQQQQPRQQRSSKQQRPVPQRSEQRMQQHPDTAAAFALAREALRTVERVARGRAPPPKAPPRKGARRKARRAAAATVAAAAAAGAAGGAAAGDGAAGGAAQPRGRSGGQSPARSRSAPPAKRPRSRSRSIDADSTDSGRHTVSRVVLALGA
jgi:hypothetical protein